MPYSDYERLAIPGGILDKLLGIEAPEMDKYEEPDYQGHDFIEGLAGMGQGMPPANTLAEGLLSGLSRGLGRQGTRLQTERKRFEEIAAERRKERDVANRQATRDYAKERRDAVVRISGEERDEGRKKRDYDRDNPEVTAELKKQYPILARIPEGERISRKFLTEETIQGPAREASAARSNAAMEKQASAAERQARIDATNTTNQLSNDYNKDPDIVSFRTASENLKTIREAKRQKSGPGDLAMVISYVRATEPGVLSVVREEEKRGVQASVGLFQRLSNMPREWVTGERLNDYGRQKILEAAEGIAESRKPAFTTADAQYRARAKDFGLDPERFVRYYTTAAAKVRPPLESFDPDVGR